MRKFFLLFALSMVAAAAIAQSKLSAYSVQRLSEYQCEKSAANAGLRSVDGRKVVQAFVRLSDSGSLAAIEALGVQPQVVAGECITALVPLDALNAVIASDDVLQVEFPRQARLLNDKARSSTGHNATLAGDESLGISPLTGKGVIYGTMDQGIDFNHINFRNDDNSTRFLSVYLPDNSSGESYTGRFADEGNMEFVTATLPGSTFNSDEAIKALTCDCPDESHGTHTLGTAAGSYNNSYRGFAPDADLIASGSLNLSDVNLVNTAAYVFDRAAELGCPAVVNFSLGSNVGMHNGLDFCAYMLDKLTGPGRIICVAAGNEGSDNVHLSHTFDQSKTLKTRLNNWYGTKYSAYVGIFSAGNIKAYLAVMGSDGQLMYQSTAACGKDNPAVSLPTGMGSYFNGSIMMNYVQGTPCGNEIYIEALGKTSTSSHILALVVEADEGDSVEMWCEPFLEFSDSGLDGYTGGDSNMSISNMACGFNSIAVGAFSTRSSDFGNLAYFSSYGPTIDGRTKPEIVGPGRSLTSSYNSYDSGSAKYTTGNVTVDGRTYGWGSMQGTSMSSPAVSGIIATWLEANPYLSPDDIKQIFEATADNDSITQAAPEKWGYGRINSFEGVKYIYQTTGVSDAVAQEKPIIVYPNSSDGRFTILTANGESALSLRVFSLSGALAASQQLHATGGAVDVDLSSSLSPGVYILSIASPRHTHTSKLIVK